MKKYPFSVLVVGAAICVSAPAWACDMHGGGGEFGSPYGMRWQSYDTGKDHNTDMNSRLDDRSNMERSRPVFSSVANRASASAKRRVQKNSEKETRPYWE